MAAKKQELIVEVTTKADQAKRDLAELDKQAKDLGGKPIEVPVDVKGTEDTQTKLKTTERAADGTRNAFANLVGNTAQDVSGLGGAFSSLGVAIGQVAEFTADAANEGGGLTAALSGAASFAGPMLALAAAGYAVTKVMGDMKQKAEESKAANDALLSSFVKGAGSLDEWAKTLDDAVGVGAADKVETFNKVIKDTLDKTGDLDKTAVAMGQLGLSTDDLGQSIGDADTDFTSFSKNLLLQRGYSQEAADAMTWLVNNNEKLGDVLKEVGPMVGKFLTPDQAAHARDYATALAQVKDVVEKIDTEKKAKEFLDLQRAIPEMTQVVDDARAKSAAGANHERDAALEVTDVIQKQKVAHEENARATEEGARASQESGTILEQVGRQVDAAGKMAADAIDKVKKSQDDWLLHNVDYQGGVDSFTESLQKLAEQTAKQTKAGDEGAASFEGNTKAALDNRDALGDVYGNALNVIQSMKDAGFSVDGARTAQDNMAQSAYDLFTALGYPVEKAQEIKDKINQIPSSVTTEVKYTEKGYEDRLAEQERLERDIHNTVFFAGVIDRSLQNAINTINWNAPPGTVVSPSAASAGTLTAVTPVAVAPAAMAAPAATAAPSKTVQVNVNMAGSIVADTFELQRVVSRAVRQGVRINGSRRYQP